MINIKRLSFKVSIPDGSKPGVYIADGIEDALDTYRIKSKKVINIIEKEHDGIYTIIIYYKAKYDN